MASIVYTIVARFVSDSNITTLLVFILTFLLVFINTRRRPGVPPGPPLIPVIGNMLSLASADILGAFRKLRGSYGDVYGVYLGSDLTIVLSGYNVIHEALIKKGSVFAMRPMHGGYKYVVKYPSIIMANGTLWKEQKRFAQNSFNTLFSKVNGRHIEHLILTEATSLVDALNEIDGPIEIDKYIKVITANVICKLVLDHRFEFDDERFIKTLSAITQTADEFGKFMIKSSCFPYLHKLPGDWLNVRCIHNLGASIISFLRPFIEKHREVDVDSTRLDFVDLYIERQAKSAEDNSNDTFTDTQLEHTCHDLLAGGNETTATSIRWILLYLIRFPAIQQKLYSEISQKIGETTPSLSDRTTLVYVEAFILEVLRIACPIPLAVPHGILKNIIFKNYLIPQTATVLVNLESVLMDPDVWENPKEFRPERFLNADETELVIPAEFIPFSLGLRSCLGESLARMELFLFLTSLVQAYEFCSADGGLPDTTGVLHLTYSPKPFQIRVIKR